MSEPTGTGRTPAGGRRRAAAPAPDPTTSRSPVLLVALLVLVVVVAASLWLAGRAGPAATSTASGESLVEPDQQQVVCPAGRSSTTTRVGLLAASGDGGQVTAAGESVDVPPGGVASRRVDADEPDVLTATGSATRGLFATRLIGDGGLAGCVSPRASWWFAGAGGAPSHASVLRLDNPGTGAAVLDVTVYGPDGKVPASGLRGISLRAGASATLPLADLAPSPGTLAVHVDVSRGLVSANVSDTVTSLVARAGDGAVDDLSAARAPSRRLSINGLTAPRGGVVSTRELPAALQDGSSAVLANPSDRSVTARLRISGKDGLSQPSGLSQTTIPPQSTVTVPLGTVVGTGTAARALVVDADGPLVGGYQSPGASDLVHGVSGGGWEGPSAAALPAGGSARAELTARSGDTTARVASYDERGRRLARRTVEVASRTTVSVAVSAKAASVVVESRGGVTGAVVVRRTGGTSVLPLIPLLDALRVPTVRPGD